MITYALVVAVGLVAGLVDGIVGTGAKITSWWREIDWRATAAYALGGIPGAALGARTMLMLPPQLVDIALGSFFLIMIPGRRWLAARSYKFGPWVMVPAGLVIGLLTGIVVSTGPITVPLF